jgi:glutamate-1-semialdehyde 2,1-aminomutase
MRWTVDEPVDLDVLNQIVKIINFSKTFGWRDILEIFKHDTGMLSQNVHIPNNEGSAMSSGEKLWRRAQRIIPGGNDFFSKRPDLFLPSGWPTYYKNAKGCLIWDLDGNQYLDMSIMGIGTNSLGYANDLIDGAIKGEFTITEDYLSIINLFEKEVYSKDLLSSYEESIFSHLDDLISCFN